MLGMVTASSKYQAVDPAGIDGSETAVAVLYENVDASAGDATGVVISRLAEVNENRLVFDAVVTEPEKAAAISQLADQLIIAR
ncbi:hypothetical protein MAIT1_05270 [Magnetofaba australis IT-1]|uniref:Uncharacterized protein n=1 Tax=Magnetofaba australis IT-1 TaxID=1434232 RepID=A0A1Y2K480_9PROT|nr:hypothetical protein MAIT1_05270 [Magnetofaba australis IT-1]